MSDDFGQTWKNIGSSLPTSAVNVIKEDSVNENIIYVGTDNGLYISLDKGASWQAFSKNLPNVAVHDLVIQPTAKHLIVATHGRSLYKANIESLQLFTDELLAKPAHVFAVNSIRKRESWGTSWSKWSEPNLPKINIPFYVNETQKVIIDIFSDDKKVNSISVDSDKGFNEAIFDVTFSDKGKKAFEKANKGTTIEKSKNDVYYLPIGKYTVKIGGAAAAFEIK